MFLTFWLRNVLRATTVCNFSSLIWPDDPPEPQIIGKTQCFVTFLPFRAPASSFFWLFLFSDLLSSTLLFSLTLPISAFHLSILSEVWLLNFLRSFKYIYIYIHVYIYRNSYIYPILGWDLTWPKSASWGLPIGNPNTPGSPPGIAHFREDLFVFGRLGIADAAACRWKACRRAGHQPLEPHCRKRMGRPRVDDGGIWTKTIYKILQKVILYGVYVYHWMYLGCVYIYIW